MLDTEDIRREFARAYGGKPRLFWAPGRVNLIGEHTDYNDGFVLPMAIDLGTLVAAAARGDRRIRVHSLNRDAGAQIDLDQPAGPPAGVWVDYVEGMARSLDETGVRLSGADLLIKSDVPLGGGLSSSAALEISVGLALSVLAGVEVDRVSLALAGQRAEHNYVGIRCGIMDQYTSSLASAGHALLIDCRSLESTRIPLDLGDCAVVVSDTRVKHGLATSQYNARREECERGVELLRELLPTAGSLRDVSVADFELHKDRLPEPVRRRSRHVVTENARTLAAARALSSGNLDEMGRLMYASHASLRDDYEVSCPELDLLVVIARAIPGVKGSRMTGGGFGGCTVSLVRRESLERFKDTVARQYEKAMGLTPAVYVVEAAGGAREIV